MKLAVTPIVYRFFGVLIVTGTCVACARSEPPGARSGAETPRPVGAPLAPTADAGHVPAKTRIAVSNEVNDAGAAVHSGAVANPEPDNDSLVDSAGQPKPQTDEKPVTSDARFQTRVALLCKAIIDGTPEVAHDSFFPLVAYRQVKAIEDPDRDYRLRLLRHFDRDILDYHRRVAKKPGPLRCAGLKVPEGQARWMKPGSEYNRIGYFRVLRSQLGLTDTNENTFSLEVTSLISWRGQWYVVHLNSFE